MNAYSNLAITTAVVLYLLAFLSHAVEWASARSVPDSTQEAGAQEAAAHATGAVRAGKHERVEQRELAAVGAGGGPDVLPEQGPEDRADVRTLLGADVAPESRTSNRTEMFGRLGVVLTAMGWVFALAGVVMRGMAADRAPWGNMYEFVITAMIFVVGAYLVMALVWKSRWLGLPLTLLATIGNGVAITVFYVAAAPLVPALHSIWFLIHIVSAALAGAAFNVGGIASILYLVKSHRERVRAEAGDGPVPPSYLDRLPGTRSLDKVAYRFHAFAFPVWTFAVAAGSIWAEYAWGRYWGWDPKETWALVTWVIYACYLHARSTAGWRGKGAAIIAIVGMASFWFNFIGVNLMFAGLHSYAGI